MEQKLKEILQSVTPLDEAAMEAARKRQAQLAKPPGSLGRLEDLSIQLAGITGRVHNCVDKKHLLVFAADNGVVEEGVASSPQSVTLMQTINLTRAKTGASVLAKHFGSGITVCDVGVNAVIRDPAVLNKKIAYGTNNMTKGPAMTRQQALSAILTGIELAQNTEADVFGIGEMGIGNTTTSSAVASVLLGRSVEEMTGVGAGLTSAGLTRKIDAIKRAIELNQPDADDAIDVLAKLGGYDIAGITGLFIGGALYGIPVLIDGFISAVSALIAQRLCPACSCAMIATHVSGEPAGTSVLDALGLEPVITAGMRLGEGTGAVCLVPMLDMALALYNGTSFDAIGLEAYEVNPQ